MSGPSPQRKQGRHLLALQAHGFDHLGEQFSGAAHEWEALLVFVCAGTFSDKNELSFRVAIAEDNFVASFVQLAASAWAEVFANDGQRITLHSGDALKERGFRVAAEQFIGDADGRVRSGSLGRRFGQKNLLG